MGALEQLEKYEPSSCRCRQCIAACRSKPGMLAPGDIERIAAYVGAEPTGEFVERSFRAADGEMATFGEDRIKVPTIVPAQHEDGRCVFLTVDERCAIHPAKPFGCSRQNGCEPENERALEACFGAIADGEEYLEQWTQLAMDEMVDVPEKRGYGVP